MKKSKQRKLERAGFQVADAKEFLGLSEEEAALIDLKVRLMRMLQGREAAEPDDPAAPPQRSSARGR